jgi:hypothetical protein
MGSHWQEEVFRFQSRAQVLGQLGVVVMMWTGATRVDRHSEQG